MDGKRKRIVIVEDEFELCSILQDHLGKAYHITVFNDAETCIDSISTLGNADVIIVDYHLPQKDGFELFRAIKPQLPNAKFVFITGFLSEEKAAEGLNLGFNAILMKPFDLLALEKLIADLTS
ncbi:MAG: response regulator [Verrucomicrobiota bacterium]